MVADRTQLNVVVDGTDLEMKGGACIDGGFKLVAFSGLKQCSYPGYGTSGGSAAKMAGIREVALTYSCNETKTDKAYLSKQHTSMVD